MFLGLCDLVIELKSNASLISDHWRQLFCSWPTFSEHRSDRPADVQFLLQMAQKVEPPKTVPIFRDQRALPDGFGWLSVYPGPSEHVFLHYGDGALLQVPLAGPQKGLIPKISGKITPAAIAYGRIEDITFAGLAPVLRRHNYYMVHAFGASYRGKAAIIVGPSGSGKTTSGLNLLMSGWQLLSNDVLLLGRQNNSVLGWPTPGQITVRAASLELLPQLGQFIGDAVSFADGRYSLPSHRFTQGIWPEAAPIEYIYLAQIDDKGRTCRQPVGRALCLAKLMEESVDKWDNAVLPAHIDLLSKLSQQAEAYTLRLGSDVDVLPRLLTPDQN